jgi:hypothetical protein
MLFHCITSAAAQGVIFTWTAPAIAWCQCWWVPADYLALTNSISSLAAAVATYCCFFMNCLQYFCRCPNPLACNHNAADDSLVRFHPYYNTFMTLSETIDQNFNESFWQVYTDKLCVAGYR